ncbi:hypothetical protein HZH68_012183 [Vespula germanica]|uniref:Uncharacterized protein n=1 Tax=Vespula germanica TaxID=30212 RepID=A0A834JMP1_VESGE|nr:hypothetical protein HZH68_012183 [Vespula germanica]
MSKSTRGDRFCLPKVRKFLSPIVEIDIQSPQNVRKFLSPHMEIECQSSQKCGIKWHSAKISKSNRGDRFSKFPESVKISKSTRGDKFSKSAKV